MGVAEILAVASAIVAALCGVIVKLYKDRAAERARADAVTEQLHRAHVRDLRSVAGIPTSLDPPPRLPTTDDDPPPTRPSRRRR